MSVFYHQIYIIIYFILQKIRIYLVLLQLVFRFSFSMEDADCEFVNLTRSFVHQYTCGALYWQCTTHVSIVLL